MWYEASGLGLVAPVHQQDAVHDSNERNKQSLFKMAENMIIGYES